jgi:UDPglucose 6-dehydrogenase
MIKHATNAFLASSLSFIYDISDVCELVGADVTQVSKGLRLDTRIGEKAYLDASAGFSGGHLERDLQYLKKISRQNNLTLPVISAVINKNKNRSQIIFDKTLPILRSLKNKKITFFGITYKSGVATLQHSLPLKVAKQMHSLGAFTNFYDPWLNEAEIAKKVPKKNFKHFFDPYKSVEGSEAIICITPWPQLRELDYKKLSKKMRGAKIFFDARNYFIDKQKHIKSAGILYIGVGRNENR